MANRQHQQLLAGVGDADTNYITSMPMDLVRHGIVPELQPHTKVAPVEPFSCEHALDGPLMRSLEINPYEFFKPVWLGSTCSAYVNSVFPLWAGGGGGGGKKKRECTPATAEAAAPPAAGVVLVNYRMCAQNRAETFASPFQSLLVRVPRGCAPTTPVAIVTVGIIATPEAIIARQLRSRELRIGAAFRYGYLAQKMERSRELIDALSDVQLKERQLLVEAHGEFGADLYATLRTTAPTILAYLVAELRAAQANKKPPIAAPRQQQQNDSGDESVGACPSIDEERGLVLDFIGSDDSSSGDDDDDEEEEPSPSGSEAVEVDEADDESEAVTTSGKKKRAKKEPAAPGVAARPAEPEFDDYRTNELQWMRVMVQQRSFEFTMELGFIGTFESLCARTRLLRIPTTSLPQSILDAIGDDEAETVEFLYGNALATPVVTTQKIGDIIAEQQDIQYGCDSLTQKEPEPLAYDELPLPPQPQRVVMAAPVVPVAVRAEVKPVQRTLMHQLAEIDLGAVTLLEFETYGQLRLSMLMQNWKNTLCGSGDRRWRPARIAYPELTWLARSLMVTTCPAALHRFKYAEALGLFVLCVAARCDDALGVNLLRTETMWYDNDDDEDGKQLHLEAIRRFWRETPDVFEATDDDVAEELTLFVEMLQRLVAAWRKFCREIEPQN